MRLRGRTTYNGGAALKAAPFSHLGHCPHHPRRGNGRNPELPPQQKKIHSTPLQHEVQYAIIFTEARERVPSNNKDKERTETMTIRQLQYAIQNAIDEVTGIPDTAEVCISDNAVGCIGELDGKKTRHIFGLLNMESVQLSPLQTTTLNRFAEQIWGGDYGLEDFEDLTDTEMAYLKETLKKTYNYNIETEKEG